MPDVDRLVALELNSSLCKALFVFEEEPNEKSSYERNSSVSYKYTAESEVKLRNNPKRECITERTRKSVDKIVNTK